MNTNYITVEGDRLDTIAAKAYGDPFNWQPILEANPGLPVQALYPAGINIVIPIVQVPASNINSLPPWKKAV
jgi:phage tail protein X